MTSSGCITRRSINRRERSRCTPIYCDRGRGAIVFLYLRVMRFGFLQTVSMIVLLPVGTLSVVRADGVSDWSVFRGDAALCGVAGGTLPDRPVLRWSFKAGDSIRSPAVIADGRVFVGCDDGVLYALRFADGERMWTHVTEAAIEAPPLVVDDTVYVGSTDAFVYAIDASDGKRKWRYETGGRILGGANLWRSPAGDRRVIVVGSYDFQLHCVDAVSGKPVWTHLTDNYVNGTPAIAGDRVVFGGCDAVVHVLSMSTGKPAAQVPVGEGAYIAGSVALADDHAYFGHYGNQFVCLDLVGGRMVWTYDGGQHPFFSSPAVDDKHVVFGGRDNQLHCVSRAGGQSLWTFRTRGAIDSSPVIIGGKVVAASTDGWLYVVSLADGRELWSYQIGRGIVASPAIVEGVIVIGAEDGRVYAFGAEPVQ